MTHGPLSWRELVERDKQKSEDARGQIKRAAMQPTPRPQEAVMQSERTTFEALNSALRFAASRSAITSAEELAIMAAWNARASDAEITRLTEALRAAEEREKALLSALEEWMFRYFWRVDGMPVEAARIHAQSRMKIAALVGAKP